MKSHLTAITSIKREIERQARRAAFALEIGLAVTVVSLGLALGIATIAQADSPSGAAVGRLVGEVETTLRRLGAPLQLKPEEVVALSEAAMQLEDDQTHRPYETAGHHVLPYYVLDSNQRASTSHGSTEEARRTVLFIGGIHADEVAPMVSAWSQLVELLQGREQLASGVRVIYAPAVNPDGLIDAVQAHGVATRENLRGVDLNRDFRAARAQPETRFIKDLIARFHPDTIISLHAPYDWLDYDGPAKIQGADPAMMQAVQNWLQAIHAEALAGLAVNNNFTIYPGSLGEYAGFNLRIHTLTFEYPSKDPTRGWNDWKLYGRSLLRALTPP